MALCLWKEIGKKVSRGAAKNKKNYSARREIDFYVNSKNQNRKKNKLGFFLALGLVGAAFAT
jgi:hypothetical protein